MGKRRSGRGKEEVSRRGYNILVVRGVLEFFFDLRFVEE